MNAGRALIAAGCVYEIVAVSTDRVPTITALVKAAGRLPWVGRFATWMLLGFIVDHFMDRP